MCKREEAEDLHNSMVPEKKEIPFTRNPGAASKEDDPTKPQRNTGGSTPHQYGLPHGAHDLQDLIEYRNMNFAIGNIFKACYRIGACDHSTRQRDIRKILWFAQRELERPE